MAEQVPKRVRKHRNKLLRELAAGKNLEFRKRMIGRTLSVVTLNQNQAALSDNYLKVELARPREPNQLADIEIGGVTEDGVRERDPLRVVS